MTSLPGQRILVVEDSWHLGVALKSLLRSVGAEVAGPVATSAEAERLIAEQVPDVAIVDFNLRGGELAFDLIDKLNELSVRVVVISSSTSVREKKSSLQLAQEIDHGGTDLCRPLLLRPVTTAWEHER